MTFRVPGAELSAVVDAVEERDRKIAEDWGIPRWHTEADPVFRDPGIDAVIIATPHDTHTPLVIEAARHNKAIFVEKPLDGPERSGPGHQSRRTNGGFLPSRLHAPI